MFAHWSGAEVQKKKFIYVVNWKYLDVFYVHSKAANLINTRRSIHCNVSFYEDHSKCLHTGEEVQKELKISFTYVKKLIQVFWTIFPCTFSDQSIVWYSPRLGAGHDYGRTKHGSDLESILSNQSYQWIGKKHFTNKMSCS